MTLSWIRRKIATQLFKLVDAFERLVERIDAPRCDDCGAVLADNEREATCEHCRRFESENLPREAWWPVAVTQGVYRFEAGEPIMAGKIVSTGEDGRLKPASPGETPLFVAREPMAKGQTIEFVIGHDGAAPFIEHEVEMFDAYGNYLTTKTHKHADNEPCRMACSHCNPVRDYP